MLSWAVGLRSLLYKQRDRPSAHVLHGSHFLFDYHAADGLYVVANEGAMRTQGSEAPASLSETTSENQLNDFWFTELRDITTYGLPMFCKLSATLDFTKVSDKTPTDPNHAGHTLIESDIKFELQRPMGKLGVFAAKPRGETGELRITGLTMLSSGTLTRNYLMPQTDETLKNITSIVGDLS